mmetsp:Transcript_1491/g.4083  ORF Transcript_1491/g.4083 Transcript_1491/m.4083 type:complete len:80 (+) Transcript_1491:140-379(+)
MSDKFKEILLSHIYLCEIACAANKYTKCSLTHQEPRKSNFSKEGAKPGVVSSAVPGTVALREDQDGRVRAFHGAKAAWC